MLACILTNSHRGVSAGVRLCHDEETLEQAAARAGRLLRSTAARGPRLHIADVVPVRLLLAARRAVHEVGVACDLKQDLPARRRLGRLAHGVFSVRTGGQRGQHGNVGPVDVVLGFAAQARVREQVGAALDRVSELPFEYAAVALCVRGALAPLTKAPGKEKGREKKRKKILSDTHRS